MSGRRHAFLLVTLVSLGLAACESSNDDDGPSVPSTETDPVSGLDISGDFAAIAARGPSDEPYALDGEALDTDLATRFGGTADEALDIDDDEDAVTVANRGR